MKFLALLPLLACAEADYWAHGMEIIIEDSGAGPTKAEFIEVTQDYFDAFREQLAVEGLKKSLKNTLVIFQSDVLPCSHARGCAGLYRPGLIQLVWYGDKDGLRGTAWAHELGHAAYRHKYGHSEHKHADTLWWKTIAGFRY